MNDDTNDVAIDELCADYCPNCLGFCGRVDHAGDIGVVNATNLIYDSCVIEGNLDLVKVRNLPDAELAEVVYELTMRYALPIPEVYRDNQEGTLNYLSGFASVIMDHMITEGNAGANVA